MNRSKVQATITEMIEEYRNNAGKWARNQYPASKTQIAKLTELGLIEFMPNAPYEKHIGHSEAKLVIEAASKSDTALFNAYDEGEAVAASELHTAINEDEQPDYSDSDDAAYEALQQAHEEHAELDALIEEVTELERQADLDALSRKFDS